MVLCMPLKVESLRFTFRLPRKLRKVRAATQCSEKQAQEKLLRPDKHPRLWSLWNHPEATEDAAKLS